MLHLSSSDSLESINAHIGSPAVRGHSAYIETLRNQVNSTQNEIHGFDLSARNSDASRDTAVYGACQQEEGDSTVKRIETSKGHFSSQVKSLFAAKGISEKWKQKLWKICVYLVTIGMLVALLVGLNMSWTIITAAVVLLVLDFKDARPVLEKVNSCQ